MKTIKLTQGKCTLVSNIDYTYLNQWKWFIVRSKKNWYAARRDNKYKVIFIHHVILNRIGKHNFIYVDHRDGDGLNNCRSNLRPATKSQNGGNRGLNKNNKSGYKGVHWETCTKKWRASIQINNCYIRLGRYTDKIKAAKAYNKAAKKYFGKFAKLNPI